MTDPRPTHPHFHDESPQVVGRAVPLVDARGKVSGEAIYTDDLKLPGMLVGKILRSPIPHGRIVRIDTARAAALPGVRAIVTGRDADARFGVLPVSEDETACAIDRVRYIGDCVAGVAAEDEETALAALRLIDVEYEELAAILSIEEGMKPTAHPLHEKTVDGTNVQKFVEQRFGDV